MKHIWHNKQWVPITAFKRRPRKGPMIITDSHEAFQSQVDGRFYDSKSAYRSSLKANGMVELGSDQLKGPELQPALDAQALSESWDQFEAQTNAGMAREDVAKAGSAPGAWRGDPYTETS